MYIYVCVFMHIYFCGKKSKVFFVKSCTECVLKALRKSYINERFDKKQHELLSQLLSE